ncbi:MAG: 5-methylthioadenosine phosphorylase [Patescibacteria group bacterium]|nr:5-methylthioadenosine phosphorylase [Patescibacteria group bacterium]
MKITRPKIGIIGGSGIYSLSGLEEIKRLSLNTKWGKTSDEIIIGNYAGSVVAFLPRHGFRHSLLPHEIPYEANMLALKNLGVESIISTCMCGSLKLKIKPGDIVIPDQFVDFTYGRDIEKTRKEIIHLPMAEPYCLNLGDIFYKSARQLKMTVHKKGTVVVIQGPRYSTKAESKWFSSQGWDIVNMTQYPECYFARKIKIHYATISMVTDYAIGVESMHWAGEDIDKIINVFNDNITKANNLIFEVVKNLPNKYDCNCQKYSTEAYYKDN